MSKTYIEQCLAGEVLLEEIDEFVAKWHEDKANTATLREFLGFSPEEYKLWAEKPEALAYIIFAHKNNIPIEKALEDQAVAARSDSHDEAKEIMEWLRKSGRKN